MDHMEQTTYNDIDDTFPVQELMAAGVFIRYDSETQITLCYPSQLGSTVRALIGK